MSVKLIIEREFKAKIKNKTFIVMTFLSPLLMVGIVAFVSYLTYQNTQHVTKIAVCDVMQIVSSGLNDSDGIIYEDITPMGIDFAKKELLHDGYAGVLYVTKNKEYNSLDFQYFSEDNPSLDLTSKIERTLSGILTQKELVLSGIDLQVIEKAQVEVNLNLFTPDGENGVKGLNEIKMGIGGAFGYLIMMFIIIYGNMVMRSVIEEKTNRIIEVIISSVKPIHLMIGKILGTSLAGILQFVIWVILGLTLLSITSVVLDIPLTSSAPVTSDLVTTPTMDVDVLFEHAKRLPIVSLLFYFIIYFAGGFLLYSSFYAAIGAAVDSETDSQQFLLPIIAPLLIGVYVGLITVVSDPHGTVAIVFSMIPFTSPIVMLMRIPFDVPWWQIAISITLLFGTFIATVWMASKIYRVGILMYGKKVTYKELFKWLKY